MRWGYALGLACVLACLVLTLPREKVIITTTQVHFPAPSTTIGLPGKVEDDGTTAATSVHLHIIAVGDSLTGGVWRRVGSKVMQFSPYVDTTKRILLVNHSEATAAVRIAGVTSEVLAFPGHMSFELIDDVATATFGSPAAANASAPERQRLLLPRGAAGVDPALVSALRTGRARDAAVDRVLFVCAVLAGTNDILRAPGSAVGRADLPSPSVEKTIASVLELHRLCSDYAAAQVSAVAASPPLAVRDVRTLLLPLNLPPAMLHFGDAPMIALGRALMGKRASVRATYGYCFTPSDSVLAMLRRHAEIRAALGDAAAAAEAVTARRGKMINGVPAAAAVAPAATSASAAAVVDVGDSGAFIQRLRVLAAEHPRRQVSVAERAVVLPVPPSEPLWTDCLHMSPAGYEIVGSLVAAAILKHL